MSVYYDLYQNPPQDGEKDERLHARVLPKGTIPADKFLEIVHNATGFSQAILDGTLQAITDELQSWLADGWIVEVGELGHFSLSLECDRLVQDKKEIRSPSIHFKNVNLRVSSKFRRRFVTMELERKESPYVSHSKLSEAQRLKLLQKHLDEKRCITRADYSELTGRSKSQSLDDLNRYVEQGVLCKYGSGRTVVYLKP
ncbi:DNA-binding protein [Bacteroides sp. GD17]|jgi:hypothetical protein|uniref:HU family DNA-binding protein n=1 Tax=Bacteroides sp. GD17 TaxID=3139826 RepID=UPI0025D36ED6|nr:DNA-binding protein [uncultured Bacteroides sp.]